MTYKERTYGLPDEEVDRSSPQYAILKVIGQKPFYNNGYIRCFIQYYEAMHMFDSVCLIPYGNFG